jgi:protein O-GlcNAc transferase
VVCSSDLFRERICRLHRIGVCFRGDHSIPQGEWRPSAVGTIWLGSFNRYIKIREAALALWAKVMHALPESKLLLEDRKSNCSSHHDRILRCLGEHGIAPDRIHFEPFIPGHLRHMRLYDRLDIALDTIPFNSGTTACDALWMGVPLVAIEGNWAGGRMAASILRAAGMSHWVARGEDEFVSIVTRLARDISGREKFRLIQRDQLANSELCDSKGLTRALQDAFVSMFDEYYARNVREQTPR